MARMALPFKFLSEIVESRDLFLHFDRDRKKGGFRWKGPHFLAFLRYLIKLRPNYNHGRFSDLLRKVEESANRLCKYKNFTKKGIYSAKFLHIMDYFLPELREFFAVPKPQQYLSCSTFKTNELVASFIDFLLEDLEEFLGQRYLSRFFTVQLNPLLKNLKFLLIILGDTPFQRTELEETNNILADIESIDNEAGIFFHSFFFTTYLVKETKIAAAHSVLLPKFKMVKEKIKNHCITVSNLPSVTTRNTDLVSIFIVDSVLDYLNHLINNKARLIVDVKDQITTLHEELNFSRSFLRDIEVQQNKELIEYEMQLRDLAYEAEYIINWFTAGEVPVWYLTLRLSNFIQKNKLIRTALPEIKLNYGINSLEVVESPCEVSSQVARSIPMVDEIIVGFKDETMQIARQLVRGPDHLQIISITGMPGLGKTTLAKKLYNHSSVLNHFDKRLWCVVSQTYERKRLLIDILRSMTNHKEVKFLEMEVQELGENLHKNLKERRYFVVMDDIWNVEAWHDLKMYFPKDKTRSRILFTSRNKEVALEASSNGIINELPFLSVDECWDLLQQKVFGKALCPREFLDVGKQIATCCKGLPLAVSGIAAVLANMEKKESLWQEVAASLSSYIFKEQDILEISYKHLPIHLKPCFLYFSAFEEDREIPVKKLLSLWISEGFIQKNEDKRSEDVAEEYLIELINRSMVQVAKRRSDNGVKACNMHDLMRDMCMRIAKEENFLNVIKE
ncbi:putative late blight resistance protein-like protein R1B-12 [Forsythia ovata]|uniref:Late blight resistance protein-like protein R1B-12 n=1 Tax=Forsythia ovata TaxID=205694 RepID=A0ABD1UUS1_9LAMI